MSDKHYIHQGDETHLELALRRSMRWFDANATFLIYGLAVVLAVIAGIVWMQRQPAANSEASALWLDANTPEDYQDIADKFEGTRLGSLARLKQADSLLNNASHNMFTDRETANKELTAAEKALDRLGNSSSIDDAVRDRIAIDQARLAEIRCDGTDASVQTSVDAWQNVIAQNDVSVARAVAEARIARLADSDASEFYAWFQPLDPKPADDLQMPGMSGPGSSVPDVPLNLDLPILEDLMQKSADDSSISAEEPAQTDSPAEDNLETEAKPADPEAASSEEAPKDGDEPAESSTESAPATEEPADGEPEADAAE